MAKHPGDDGDWNLNSADMIDMSIKKRVDTQLGVTSPEVIAAMRAEEAFYDTVEPLDMKRFTDRRPIPGRSRLIP